MSRKKFVAGNWKMYKTPDEVKKYFVEFLPLVEKMSERPEIIFFAPAYDFSAMSEALANSAAKFSIGAQNIYHEKEGAFTGELSPVGVKAAGARLALIGHSERRTLFGETDDMVAKKVKAAIDTGLTPMLCIGELLKEREAGETIDVVSRQLVAGLSRVNAEANVIIAYEPVWAIGTGKVATTAQAEETHAAIRKIIGDILGDEKAERTTILYGGSVKPDNAEALSKQPNIDGFLVGGASLKPADFSAIIKSTGA